MQFSIEKEELFNALRNVERATVQKGLQPVLANILIETPDNSSIKMTATDLDITIVARAQAQVKEEGKITLPAKTLSEIVARLGDKIVDFELKDANIMTVKCQNAKFDIIGISASEFPNVGDTETFDKTKSIEIEIKPFVKAIRQAGFAAAGVEGNNLLSGVVCDIQEKTLEMASTDGNRLARVREEINNKEGKTQQMIIPSRTLQEFSKISSFVEEKSIQLFAEKTRLVLKSDKILLISRLMEGQYPKYNQLIPQESPKEAIVKISQLITALERVSVMVNEKTSIVKFAFADNRLTLTADTPDAGASEDTIDVDFAKEELTIAFNYKYVLDSLRNMDSDEVKIGLNSPLSATVFRPNNDEDYICLVMPVQIK